MTHRHPHTDHMTRYSFSVQMMRVLVHLSSSGASSSQQQSTWVSNVSEVSLLILSPIAKFRSDLYQVISENAPDAIKTGEIKNHFGRKVAIVRCERFFGADLDS